MAMERNGTPVGTAVETHELVNVTGDTNHNKYWQCSLYTSGDVEIRFGRVGITETKGVHRNAGKSFMLKKMGEKKKGKVNKKTGQREPYTEIDVLSGSGTTQSSKSSKVVTSSKLKDIATKQIEHSSPATAKLIKWLADVNRHQIADISGGDITWNADKGLFQTPRGIIPPSSISEARSLLNSIANDVVGRKWSDGSFVQSVNRYLTIVPHNLGMRWSPQSFLPDTSALQRENNLLDALDASYASAISSTKDKKDTKKVKDPKVFETKLILVTDKRVIDRINKKYTGSANRQHYQVRDFKLKKVWKVEVGLVSRNFEKYSRNLGNIKELYHGTSAANLLSCLKLGLKTSPPSSAHITGKMFGSTGIYASDQSTKALNYATSFWGNKDLGRYFMFIVDFAMGKEYTPSRNDYTSYPVRGYDSTFAKAGASGVQNNEMIVYRDDQVNLKFLMELGR